MNRAVSVSGPSVLAGAVLAVVMGLALSVTPVSAGEMASGISAPSPVKRESPAYPRGAQKRGIEGWVLLEYTVDENGDVTSPRVIDSSPPGVFDSAALEALMEWKYAPAKMGATAVATPGLRIKLTFALRSQ
jgi:protein TonB